MKFRRLPLSSAGDTVGPCNFSMFAASPWRHTVQEVWRGRFTVPGDSRGLSLRWEGEGRLQSKGYPTVSLFEGLDEEVLGKTY